MTKETDYIAATGLSVGRDLYRFCTEEALPGTGVDPDAFWWGLAGLVDEFSPRNADLLEIRQTMQSAIDAWHGERLGQPHDAVAYRQFLSELGYLLPEGPGFSIETDGVDPEISSVAGPQLVVPVTNARYALNAANARWGSLYDAFYGTDALGDLAPPGPYDPERGARVIDRVRSFLDDAVPLSEASHRSAIAYHVIGGGLAVTLDDGSTTTLADSAHLAGYNGDPAAPTRILLTNNGLGIELVIDPSDPVGAEDGAGIADVILESAVTSIIDCEDSVATVNSADKALAYHNWLGLMTGALTEEVTKDGSTFIRALDPDRTYLAPDGSSFRRPGRALMLTRNVGHLMTTPAVLDPNGRPIPEGLLDALVTVLCAKHDLAKEPIERNSPAGSVYVVKPKMHGPDEVAFACDVFSRVESILGLASNTVKIGIMDEERRTTLNLKECIRAASS
ncbi:MAG: malate synthase G, partial [Actinomycetia bacterium]|nr:malate synthase G [Actinomycetes bacterium]